MARTNTKTQEAQSVNSGREAIEKMTEDQLNKLKEECKTKSAVIRKLAADNGHDHKSNNLTSAIAKRLDIRYQHVRNVLTQELKRDNQEAKKD